MPNLTNNQYDYMYPTSSPKPHCQSVTFLAWKKGLITIENGGQVATLVKTIIQQNNEFGAKMIIYPKMVKACAPSSLKTPVLLKLSGPREMKIRQ